jgi:hypothetical protein
LVITLSADLSSAKSAWLNEVLGSDSTGTSAAITLYISVAQFMPLLM